MFQEVVELVQFAEELGFDAVAFPEHHLHSEGFEMGAPPEFIRYVALHTKRIQVGPIGYVLPGWDPLRLAVTTAWVGSTNARTFRFPEDEFEYPSGEKRLPPDEWTVERMMRANYLYAGSVDDVVKGIDALVDAANPEWFAWLFDQGL